MRWPVLSLLLFLALPAVAQDIDPAQTERDRSYLTGLIEDTLSGAGREIRLEGFTGALSSQARFETLTIADDKGVWLTIRGGTMAWDRAALLTGRVAVQELTATEIDLPRLPEPVPGDTAPEARPFALPKLPVAVEIGSVKAEKLVLGAPVLGQDATFQLDGSLRLSGGDGETAFSANRTDGKKGRFTLRASYAEGNRQTVLDLLLTEGKEGIVSGLLGLPDRPSLTLSMSGLGPIDDFRADVLLGTAGVSRLTGTVALRSKPRGESGVDLALSGDVSPLFPPDYQSFFGTASQLSLAAQRSETGMTRLTRLDLRSQALAVQGSMDILPGGLPERIDLAATLGLAEGPPVVLPIPGPKTGVQGGDLHLQFDRSRSDGWRLSGNLTGLSRADDTIARIDLAGSGRIGQPGNGLATAGGTVRLSGSEIALSDPGLAEALGPRVEAAMQFFWQQGKPLSLPDLSLRTRDFDATGRLSVTTALDLSGQGTAEHRNLHSLSTLLGRSMAGRLRADVGGRFTLTSGAFDATAVLDAHDLGVDQPLADALLAGAARIEASALRDETGLTLRGFSAKTTGLSLLASGQVSSAESSLTAKLDAPGLTRLGPGFAGSVATEAKLTGPLNRRQITVTGRGQNLVLPQPGLDRILAGQSLFSLVLAQREGSFHLADLTLSTPQASVNATPRKGQTGVFDLSARLANVALLAPAFPGPLAVTGSFADQGQRYALDLRGTGPGGSEAAIKGTVARDFSSSDLTLAGRAETALANAFIAPQSVQGPLSFDLALRGKPGLAALSGQVFGRNLRLVAPKLGQTLQNVDLQANLVGGGAQITGQGSFDGGGTLEISGPVQLTAPFPAKLSLLLNRARLRDPSLYDTRISGDLAITGGLTAALKVTGDLRLDETELRIPAGGLGGAAAIPELTHLHEPGPVRQTRVRAGLIDTGPAREGPARMIGLDVMIRAPQQIFVRGRGLDAELGGQLRVTGTTVNIVPVGEFSLIRGRLDVLGKRFTLTEGQVALQGALTPWVMFKATIQQDDLDITFKLEGDATEPLLTITSAPDLPEEEILARLLFNKGLSTLSPLQAAQLAAAVATLAGKGGDGIVARLRQGFGLDDLDIGTDEGGNATVKAGKYLAKNVYSGVSVDSSGKAEVTLNLDLSKNVTARVSVGSDSTSSAGVFFEKDY